MARNGSTQLQDQFPAQPGKPRSHARKAAARKGTMDVSGQLAFSQEEACTLGLGRCKNKHAGHRVSQSLQNSGLPLICVSTAQTQLLLLLCILSLLFFHDNNSTDLRGAVWIRTSMSCAALQTLWQPTTFWKSIIRSPSPGWQASKIQHTVGITALQVYSLQSSKCSRHIPLGLYAVQHHFSVLRRC